MSRIHRRGFTIVEVMMVILIIALLAALLTNALQSSRETARRTQCMNKMREVGQAVIKYETDNHGYPGWCHPFGVDPTTNRPRYLNNWIYQILPTLGRKDVFDTKGVDGLNTPIPPVTLNDLLVCPSDSDKMAMRSPQSPTSIVCNAGRQDLNPPPIGLPADCGSNAVFMNRYDKKSDNSAAKVDVTDASFIAKSDGLAYTLLLSENVDAGSWSTLQLLPPEPPGQWPNEAVNNCILFWPQPQPYDRINGPKGPIDHLARPSSYHSGGVNMFFCDGHGRFVRDTMEYWVYCALMTPRGSTAWDPGSTSNAPPITQPPRPITEADFQ